MRHSIKKRDNVAKSRPGSNTGVYFRARASGPGPVEYFLYLFDRVR